MTDGCLTVSIPFLNSFNGYKNKQVIVGGLLTVRGMSVLCVFLLHIEVDPCVYWILLHVEADPCRCWPL